MLFLIIYIVFIINYFIAYLLNILIELEISPIVDDLRGVWRLYRLTLEWKGESEDSFVTGTKKIANFKIIMIHILANETC